MQIKTKNFIVISTLLISTVFSPISQASEQKKDNIYISAIENEKRNQSDKKYDEKRNPWKILPFTQIKAGDKVLELGAGGGYTTELLSWVVGESGRVYAHFLYNQERLKDNRLPNVISLRQHSLNDHKVVLKENKIENNSLDAIVVFFVLHDIYLNNEMSDELLATLYKALKPGGNLIILDNAANPDSGLAQIGTLHRIGENFVKVEIEKAGFVLVESTDVLRNKKDDHTKPWGDFEGLQDRFAFRFEKPVK
ncbi:MAG: methyltransferase domain-containing protein [Gammaproteobacteria bacterium]|nr:methyltransferase domain-containing protein [Gammaproteobacteria bacterium]MDH5630529.1 methyltransferase domain-containing protein [Gammaproteobacteria bacterium]